MGALVEQMEFGGDAGVFQGEGELQAVFGSVIEGVGEEDGRQGGVEIGGDGILESAAALQQAAGIDERGEVGPARLLIGGVCDGIIATGGMSDEPGTDLTAGGEADEAEGIRVDPPTGGIGPDESHGTLGVEQSGEGGGGHAVLEDEGGDADGIEPVRDFQTLVFVGEALHATAGNDQHSGAVPLVDGSEEDFQGGLGDIGQLKERARSALDLPFRPVGDGSSRG